MLDDDATVIDELLAALDVAELEAMMELEDVPCKEDVFTILEIAEEETDDDWAGPLTLAAEQPKKAMDASKVENCRTIFILWNPSIGWV